MCAWNLLRYSVLKSFPFSDLIFTALDSPFCVAEGKLIKDLGVFTVTAMFSVFAYAWLLYILVISSPNMVEVPQRPACILVAHMAQSVAALPARKRHRCIVGSVPSLYCGVASCNHALLHCCQLPVCVAACLLVASMRCCVLSVATMRCCVAAVAHSRQHCFC